MWSCSPTHQNELLCFSDQGEMGCRFYCEIQLENASGKDRDSRNPGSIMRSKVVNKWFFVRAKTVLVKRPRTPVNEQTVQRFTVSFSVKKLINWLPTTRLLATVVTIWIRFNFWPVAFKVISNARCTWSGLWWMFHNFETMNRSSRLTTPCFILLFMAAPTSSKKIKCMFYILFYLRFHTPMHSQFGDNPSQSHTQLPFELRNSSTEFVIFMSKTKFHFCKETS